MLLRSGGVFRVFLFTDVEGSTSRWEKNELAMRGAMARHDAVLRQAITSAGGEIFMNAGDGLCAVFANVRSALRAAQAAQTSLQKEDFTAVGGIAIRMAVHGGTVEARDGDYFGPPLNRTARLVAAAHGGQIVLSASAAAQTSDLPPGCSLRDLGWHRLRDLAQPEHVFQLLASKLTHDFPVLRSLDSMPHNLPRQATSFVGRDEEMAAIRDLLAKNRLVTLLGSGGLGKTRLSLQVGMDCLSRFTDGVWLIELAPLTQAAQIAEAVAVVLGLTGQTITTGSVVTYLKYQRLLLILDNCEHLIDGVAALADAILTVCPHVTLLATSRELLRVRGEQIFPVPTLGVPGHTTGLSPAEAMAHTAINLFVERAALAAPGFTLDEANAPAIGAICRQLDGIALAIELAAARVNLLSPPELLERLCGQFDVLSGGSRTALPRQQTLRAAIAWSFDLLSPHEQRALCRLAVFEGSFSLATAKDVMATPPIGTHEVFDLIAALADKSMISRLASNAGASRYRMLETTRQFCFEKLSSYSETDVARRHLAVAMVALYEHGAQSWASAHTDDWYAAYAPDFENLSAAVEWALQTDRALALELVSVAGSVCYETSNTSSLRRWYDAAETLIGAATPALVEARIKFGCATTRALGKGANVAAMKRALELYRALGDIPHVALCLAFMTWAPLYDGVENAEYQRACLEEVKPMLPGLEPDRIRAIVIKSFASSASPDAAIPLYEEAESIARTLGDKNRMLWCVNSLSLCHFDRGDVETAMTLTRQGVTESRESGDKWLVGAFLCEMIGFGCLTGSLGEARQAVPGALESFRSFDHQLGVEWVIERVALLAACEGKPRQAAQLAGYCEAAFTARGWARGGSQPVMQARVAAILEGALPPEDRAALMREGAGWSAEKAYNAALAFAA